MVTEQEKAWSGEFGREYTERNNLSVQQADEISKNRFGITRTEMNSEFIGQMSRQIKILEVGSNIGNQLMILQNMGFQHLYGIELQWDAVEIARERTKNINIIQGSAFDIPFKDKYFDLVFTSGVLIHIAPSDIGKILKEIYRCTTRYIWGNEYFAEKYTEINYRGHENLLWKTNFAKLYLDAFNDLRLVKEKRFKYSDSENEDCMFLLEKR